MTRHEQQTVGRVLTHVWRTRLTLGSSEPDTSRTELDEALRQLITLISNGQDDLAALAEAAGPLGHQLYHRITRREDPHEAARQLRLALDDAR